MKASFDEHGTLIIEAEDNIELVALRAWQYDRPVLIGKYLPPKTCRCHLPQVHGHLEKDCPYYVAPTS